MAQGRTWWVLLRQDFGLAERDGIANLASLSLVFTEAITNSEMKNLPKKAEEIIGGGPKL